MSYTGLIAKLAAALSLGIAGASGVNTVQKVLSPPAIEGSGLYDGPVAAGEIVVIDWTITKRIDCDGDFSRVWSGADGFYMVEPQRKSGLPTTDKPHVYHIQTKIPDLAPVGELVLSIKGAYHCESGDINFDLGPVILEVIEDELPVAR